MCSCIVIPAEVGILSLRDFLDTGLRRYDGFLFHMPGKWEIRVDVAAKDGRARFRIPVTVTR